MHRPLNVSDRVSISEIVIYTGFLIAGVILCFRHGVSKSAGWRFCVILSIIRILGSALFLATINDPDNEDLYVGHAVLNGLGLGPLILLLIGLESRLFDSINRQGHVLVRPVYQRLIQILMLVGMILLIVGGTQSKFSFVDGVTKVNYSPISSGGAGVMIAVLVFLLLHTLILIRHHGYIAQGEHRILVAVCISMPFAIVRLAYTCYLIFGDKKQDVWLYLGAGIIMEIVIVLVCVTMGFTLQKAPPMPRSEEGGRSFGSMVQSLRRPRPLRSMFVESMTAAPKQ